MVQEHDEWYTQYETKMKANKEAIKKWKQSKQKSVNQIPADSTPEIIPLTTPLSEQEMAKERKHREFQKYQLALWKKEQQRLKEESLERKQQQESKERERQKMEQLQRKLEYQEKKAIKEWSKSQSLASCSLKSETDKGSTQTLQERKTNNLLVLALQKGREAQVLSKKQEIARKKQQEEAKKELRLKKLKDSVDWSYLSNKTNRLK